MALCIFLWSLLIVSQLWFSQFLFLEVSLSEVFRIPELVLFQHISDTHFNDKIWHLGHNKAKSRSVVNSNSCWNRFRQFHLIWLQRMKSLSLYYTQHWKWVRDGARNLSIIFKIVLQGTKLCCSTTTSTDQNRNLWHLKSLCIVLLFVSQCHQESLHYKCFTF